MSEYRDQRVKEQAEAYVRQLRTVPHSAAIDIMEHVLNELEMYREIYRCEPKMPFDDSCHRKPKN